MYAIASLPGILLFLLIRWDRMLGSPILGYLRAIIATVVLAVVVFIFVVLPRYIDRSVETNITAELDSSAFDLHFPNKDQDDRDNHAQDDSGNADSQIAKNRRTQHPVPSDEQKEQNAWQARNRIHDRDFRPGPESRDSTADSDGESHETPE
ncbi:hypothetical protein PYCC9005_000825 [Savitreella phatthalungensis]